LKLILFSRYYVAPGKVDGYSIVNGSARPIFTGCKAILPIKSSATPGNGVQEGGCLESCPDEDENLDFTRGIDELYLQSLATPGASNDAILGTSRSRTEKVYRKKRRWGVDDEIVSSILKLLEQVIITPPKKIIATIDWEDNIDLQNLPENDKDVVKAFQRWNFKTKRMTTNDFIQFYEDLESPKFLFQDVEDSGEVYYNIEDSTKYAIQFIEFQTFGKGQEFVQNLFNVLDKRIPKKNTFDVMSSPSCGKTWFFDMICDFYINVGHMKNFTKYSQFPLQDCRERRVLLWNEPNCHPEALDTLKTIFGGDRCAANIKCKEDEVINRTPLIVTGNSRIFPNSDAMNERRFVYEFTYWPELKEIGVKKLMPLCWKYVLNHYNVKYT
jgi:hypothetical protein